MNKQARAIRDAAGLSYTQALRVLQHIAVLRIWNDTECQVLHMPRPVFVASDTRLITPSETHESQVYNCQCDACLADPVHPDHE